MWNGRSRKLVGFGVAWSDTLKLVQVGVTGQEELVVCEHGESLGTGGAWREAGGVDESGRTCEDCGMVSFV